MNTKVFFSIVICCIFYGCKENKGILQESVISDDNSRLIRLDLPPIEQMSWVQKDISNILDDIKYVVLEMTDESIIGGIDQVEIYENRIYVLDIMTSSLFVFSLDGHFLFKINEVGEGPEEYVQLDYFSIDHENKHVVLTDLMGYRIMRFDLNGKFVSRKKIPFWVEGSASIPGKGIALYANYRNNTHVFEQEYNLLLMDSTMHINKAYFPYNSLNYMGIKFTEPVSFYYFKNRCHIKSDHHNSIYEIDGDKLISKYVFDFGENTFDIKKIQNVEVANDYLKNGSYYHLLSACENDTHLVFTFSNSSFPFMLIGFFSKESGEIIYSSGFKIGDYSSGSIPIAAYDSWVVLELDVSHLLNWKESMDNEKVKPDSKAFIDRKRVADKIELDDNPILMFYKLKSF